MAVVVDLERVSSTVSRLEWPRGLEEWGSRRMLKSSPRSPSWGRSVGDLARIEVRRVASIWLWIGIVAIHLKPIQLATG